MKLLIASDIHGSAYYCEELLKAFESENADRLLLLGDILYHGPRNDLPKEYSPKTVIELLNRIKERIFCIRGNCDTEVDQMVLDFPILADYCILPVKDKILYASHGHKYNPENPPPLSDGDILLNGHTHIPMHAEYEKFIYINPGSVSIPKNSSPHSYIILQGDIFSWKNLETFNEYDRLCIR